MRLATMATVPAAAANPPRHRILLRSSWQTVNIGDIAHTPGVLALLEHHLPDAEITLWPSKVDHGVAEMLQRRFPRLKILTDKSAVEKAFTDCDFLLHGSGPSLVAEKDVRRWADETGKPYGIFGITLAPPHPNTLAVLNGAKFVFFRDSQSLGVAKSHHCQCPILEFGPDGAFAVDVRDDAKAAAFLQQHGLEDGKFLCCIPRLRHTPYWTIPEKNAAFDQKKHDRNEAMKEHDLAPLREAIALVIKETDLKVLLCPEDQTQMAVGQEMLLNKLPLQARERVIWRPDFWLTDEALSTYKRSAGLFGAEMHSPIMCIGQGIPAIVCRWAEQTSKGLMWKDIGLGDWLFDFDQEADLQRLPAAVLSLAKNPEAAKAKAAAARALVQKRQAETMAILKSALS